MPDNNRRVIAIMKSTTAQDLFKRLAWRPIVTVQAVVIAASVLTAASSVGAQASSGSYTDLQEAGIHSTAIEALAADGVFDGTECGIESFCPGDALKRWTAAVWLVRAVDTTEPTADGESLFADIDGSNWWSAHVNRLVELEVTNGCDEDNFCPDNAVNRGQMATFLHRAFGLPAAPAAGFTDIDGNTHEESINALAAAGITSGCSTDPAPILSRHLGDTSPGSDLDFGAHCNMSLPQTMFSSAAVPVQPPSQTSQASQGQQSSTGQSQSSTGQSQSSTGQSQSSTGQSQSSTGQSQSSTGQSQSSNPPTGTGTNNPPTDSSNANQANQSSYLFGGFERVVASGSETDRTIELYGALPCPAYETATLTASPGTQGAAKKITATYRVKDAVFEKYGMDFVCAAVEVPFGPWKISLGSGIGYPFTVQLAVRQVNTQVDPSHITYTCNRAGDCTAS